MNGAHDMGGTMGYGPVSPEPDEPVFHARWEARMFALALAAGELGAWTLDEDRHACENRPPAEYIRMSYYEIWHAAFSRLLVEKGLATAEELAGGHSLRQDRRPERVLRPGDIPAALLARGSHEREIATMPAFTTGARVRARKLNPAGHTRLPRYLRGKPGEVVAVRGAHVFPDANAHGHGEDPRPLYTVRFGMRDVWGRDNLDTLCADLWEPYLEPA